MPPEIIISYKPHSLNATPSHILIWLFFWAASGPRTQKYTKNGKKNKNCVGDVKGDTPLVRIFAWQNNPFGPSRRRSGSGQRLAPGTKNIPKTANRKLRR